MSGRGHEEYEQQHRQQQGRRTECDQRIPQRVKAFIGAKLHIQLFAFARPGPGETHGVDLSPRHGGRLPGLLLRAARRNRRGRDRRRWDRCHLVAITGTVAPGESVPCYQWLILGYKIQPAVIVPHRHRERALDGLRVVYIAGQHTPVLVQQYKAHRAVIGRADRIGPHALQQIKTGDLQAFIDEGRADAFDALILICALVVKPGDPEDCGAERKAAHRQ